jgi:hypothetical protein
VQPLECKVALNPVKPVPSSIAAICVAIHDTRCISPVRGYSWHGNDDVAQNAKII